MLYNSDLDRLVANLQTTEDRMGATLGIQEALSLKRCADGVYVVCIIFRVCDMIFVWLRAFVMEWLFYVVLYYGAPGLSLSGNLDDTFCLSDSCLL